MNQEEKTSLEEILITLKVLKNKIFYYHGETTDWFLYLTGSHLENAILYLEKVVKDADRK